MKSLINYLYVSRKFAVLQIIISAVLIIASAVFINDNILKILYLMSLSAFIMYTLIMNFYWKEYDKGMPKNTEISENTKRNIDKTLRFLPRMIILASIIILLIALFESYKPILNISYVVVAILSVLDSILFFIFNKSYSV